MCCVAVVDSNFLGDVKIRVCELSETLMSLVFISHDNGFEKRDFKH